MGRGPSKYFRKTGELVQVINPDLKTYLMTGKIVGFKGKYPTRMVIVQFNRGQVYEFFYNELKKVK